MLRVKSSLTIAAAIAVGVSCVPLDVAHAVNECGLVAPGGTVTCNNDGVPASDSDPYAGGIRYVVNGITLNIDGTTNPISIVRPVGDGIVVIDFGGTGPLVLNALGTVNVTAGRPGTGFFNSTYGIGIGNPVGAATINYNDGTIIMGPGEWNVGISIRSQGPGDATINYNSGTISTVNNNSYPISAFTFGSGNAVINYNSGLITGTGAFAGGPYARALRNGDAIVTYESGSVTSSGYRGFGAIAQTDGAGDATVLFRSGTVQTSGFQAIGVHAYVGGSGALLIDVGQNSDITTSGPFANGILGTIAPTTNTQSLTINNAGQATTSGFSSHGIWGWHGGPGEILITNTGDLTATGVNADGIRAEANTTGTYEVNALAGMVISGTGAAAGIHTLGISGGTINIAAPTIIDGSASGIGILDETGPLTLNTFGTITGNVLSQGGNDTLNLLGGSLTGDVSAGTGLGTDVINLSGTIVSGFIHADDLTGDLATDGDDRFVWSGGNTAGFRGGAGSDTAIVTAGEYNGMQVLDGGDDHTIADGWIDTLSLSGITITANSANILNWETISITNGANVTFAGSTLQTGATAGIDPSTGLPYGLVVGSGSAARFANSFLIEGNLNNFGVVDLTADNTPGTVLTVQSNYVSTSFLLVDALLYNGGANNSTDQSIADQIIILGDATGTTNIRINNRGGKGASTDRNKNGIADPTEGLLIAQVQGNATAHTFGLQAPIYAGAYQYYLTAFDPSQSESGFWDYVLVSLLSPSVPVYEAMPLTVTALNKMPTLQQRVGNRSWSADNDEYGSSSGTTPGKIEGSGLWARIVGDIEHFDPQRSTKNTEFDVRSWRIQAGLDVLLLETAQSEKLIGAITAHHGRATADAKAELGSGKVKTEGLGIGATLTWYQPGGFYVDGQFHWTRFENDFESRELGSVAKGKDAFAHALSVEAGQRVTLAGHWSVTPQAQLIYSSINFENFNDLIGGGNVALRNTDGLQGRAGISIDWQKKQISTADKMAISTHVYGIANLRYDFLDDTYVDFAGVILEHKQNGLIGEAGLGWTLNLNNDQTSFYGEATIATGLSDFADSYSARATIGVRTKF